MPNFSQHESNDNKVAFIDNFDLFGIEKSKVLNYISSTGGPQKRKETGKVLMLWWCRWNGFVVLEHCDMIVILNCSREAWVQSTIFPRFVSYAYMGGSVGTVLTYPCCGWLLSWAKWEVWFCWCLMDHIFSQFYLFLLLLCYFTIFTLLASFSVGVLHDRRGHPALVNSLVYPCTRSTRGPSKVFNVFSIRFGSDCIQRLIL